MDREQGNACFSPDGRVYSTASHPVFSASGTWVQVPAGARHHFGYTGKGHVMALGTEPPEGDVNPLNGC